MKSQSEQYSDLLVLTLNLWLFVCTLMSFITKIVCRASKKTSFIIMQSRSWEKCCLGTVFFLLPGIRLGFHVLKPTLTINKHPNMSSLWIHLAGVHLQDLMTPLKLLMLHVLFSSSLKVWKIVSKIFPTGKSQETHYSYTTRRITVKNIFFEPASTFFSFQRYVVLTFMLYIGPHSQGKL